MNKGMTVLVYKNIDSLYSKLTEGLLSLTPYLLNPCCDSIFRVLLLCFEVLSWGPIAPPPSGYSLTVL